MEPSFFLRALGAMGFGFAGVLFWGFPLTRARIAEVQAALAAQGR